MASSGPGSCREMSKQMWVYFLQERRFPTEFSESQEEKGLGVLCAVISQGSHVQLNAWRSLKSLPFWQRKVGELGMWVIECVSLFVVISERWVATSSKVSEHQSGRARKTKERIACTCSHRKSCGLLCVCVCVWRFPPQAKERHREGWLQDEHRSLKFTKVCMRREQEALPGLLLGLWRLATVNGTAMARFKASTQFTRKIFGLQLLDSFPALK